MRVVSFDFDSTLSDTRHRQHKIDRVNGTDWAAYGLMCVDDPVGPAYPLAKFFSDYNIPWIIVSGRAEEARAVSEAWLEKYELYPVQIFLSDHRHAGMDHAAWKALRLQQIQKKHGFEIAFHVEDMSSVAVAAEAIGIPTMLVHPIGVLEDSFG